jgi:hypothetical protein
MKHLICYGDPQVSYLGVGFKKILNIHHDISETAKHKGMKDLDRNPN